MGRGSHELLRQRGLVAIDVSASGCRLSGIGAPPPAGAVVRLDISATTYGEAQWLSAEVMRVETSAFGRYLLGLRFILESLGRLRPRAGLARRVAAAVMQVVRPIFG